MAGHVRYTAMLDACVLFPIATCNALMSVAGTGIFAAKWTAVIDDEWTRNLAAAKGIEVEKLARRRDLMHAHVPIGRFQRRHGSPWCRASSCPMWTTGMCSLRRSQVTRIAS